MIWIGILFLNKINESSKKIKNYMYLNITFLLLSIYVIFFPFFAKALNLISPNLTKCPYNHLTGSACPLCGGTRYIKNLGTVFNDITYLFNFFGIVILCVIFEICFRIFVIYKLKKNKYSRKIVVFDIIWHIILTVSFFTYEILFILK